LSQARGALSSWWNTLTTVQSPEGEVSGPVPVAEEAETHENEGTGNHNNIQDSSLEKLESGELIPSSLLSTNIFSRISCSMISPSPPPAPPPF
jgi:hypothetical protein